ncbi:hypothetical protein WKI65_44180 [Streptomyces sp. MS1.AVA.3]|uniref:hypothetical protein n=1 Tax=Streptomyces decoyicus TaxID=249567 RepID=UPI0030C18000
MNSMKAAPVITMPPAIARHVARDASAHPDPGMHALAHAVTQQLHPARTVTLTLAPRDLHDVHCLLLEFAIDLADGFLSTADCGFTLAEVQKTIDAHEHFLHIHATQRNLH